MGSLRLALLSLGSELDSEPPQPIEELLRLAASDSTPTQEEVRGDPSTTLTLQLRPWIELCSEGLSSDFKSASTTLDQLEQRLALRTYLLGYTPSAADYAMFAAIRGATILATTF